MVIPDRVRRTVSRARARGVTVTLATGRMLASALPFAQELRLEAPLICYHGGLIQAPGAERPLYRATMDPQIVRQALDWRPVTAENDWHVVLYAGDGLFVTRRLYPERFYRDWLGQDPETVDDLSAVLDRHDPFKFLVVAEPHEVDRIEAALRERFEGDMQVVRSHARLVEGNPLGVSKGDALRRLAQHLEVARGSVMAVGDQDNDASMVGWAGVGVAMGNASPATKAAADWIAPPFEEDGAAAAIERFILTA